MEEVKLGCIIKHSPVWLILPGIREIFKEYDCELVEEGLRLSCLRRKTGKFRFLDSQRMGCFFRNEDYTGLKRYVEDAAKACIPPITLWILKLKHQRTPQ